MSIINLVVCHCKDEKNNKKGRGMGSGKNHYDLKTTHYLNYIHVVCVDIM